MNILIGKYVCVIYGNKSVIKNLVFIHYQFARLNWANPSKFFSSGLSSGLNPVDTLKVITLLGGGFSINCYMLLDMIWTSLFAIRPLVNNSAAIPSVVSLLGWYSNRISLSSFFGFLIRKTMLKVFWSLGIDGADWAAELLGLAADSEESSLGGEGEVSLFGSIR